MLTTYVILIVTELIQSGVAKAGRTYLCCAGLLPCHVEARSCSGDHDDYSLISEILYQLSNRVNWLQSRCEGLRPKLATLSFSLSINLVYS